MEMNFLAILVAAISALVVGFVWYNPKVFGNAWMKAAGMTEEQIKGGNMAKIFVLAFIFAVLLSMSLMPIVIHQMGAYSLVQGELGILPSYEAFLNDYGNAFRTYKHGAFHGVFAGIFIALPILGTNALFERKSAKYILINSGYWIVTLGIMGAIICGWR
ncbi:MAG: DUF1761 domain-containing protein [Flavobacteriales bacterium]|nr:DUF1761 domain-containing protein [Flavobacteriales bacterium]PIV93857.1 MAG: DUF1761 domain-containing protein [Flavobacteriaceae bacterium CG17_big_fil_post_rev_8_21_14_2_50_33_15]PIY09376.1 MAG: DUF1761 domain-containing protein [Flavobacteriaceae bacterium CG_4_10_14_3_um_filter_33_47]PJB17656.1 MAG: DUF1761 domain-containing protein [Flavobacteriaceae bacterium CG_4_9_14_3_um_filter_33_16]NCP52063.1 DUF1761 domain-containing protein [Flavobacteriales bacterium]